MNLYANGYTVSAKNTGTEVILSFFQESPIHDTDGTVSSISKETVASLVMHPDLAKALVSSITEMLITAEPNPAPSSQ